MFVAVFYWVLTVFFLIIYLTMTYTRIPQVPWTTVVSQPRVFLLPVAPEVGWSLVLQSICDCPYASKAEGRAGESPALVFYTRVCSIVWEGPGIPFRQSSKAVLGRLNPEKLCSLVSSLVLLILSQQ